MQEGLFISVEGGEGVGKTTFIESLSRKLNQLGVDSLHCTREPGGTKVADRIREIFAYPPKGETLDALTELFLICASRSHHVSTVLQPALRDGAWIICDRYSDSTRVYQGALGGLTDEIEPMLKIAEQSLQPDITFLLDCPVEIALSRLVGRKDSGCAPTRYDSATTKVHQRMRDCYIQVQQLNSNRIKLIDSSGDTKDAVQEAVRYLKKWL